jgi:dTDP-4-amino-4,6-dideoxygalactose transaminase
MSGGKNAVPFLDLMAPHVELKQELMDVVSAALDKAGFIGGPQVQGLEAEFAAFCETREAIALSSGTDAVRFALMAAGVEAGDIAVTVPNTFIATTEAISQAGMTPVFVDVDERTYNMDPAKLQAYLELECTKNRTGQLIDKKTKKRIGAIVPVHLYGQMCDMDPIMEMAEKYNLVVVEDACQAHGAEYFSKKQNRWCKAGSMGNASAFSFYPGKNLGACGEGGACTTNDPEIAKKIRMLRDHGQSRKYYHDMEGYNGRLDSIQAGFLRVKLKHLAKWNEQRRAAAENYGKMFAETEHPLVLPYVPEWAKPVFHLYVVRVADREQIMKQLEAVGIATGIHYPFPLHLSTPYFALGYRPGDLPVAEKAAAEVMSLPMFPTLTEDQQRRVVAELMQLVGAQAVAALQ